MMLRRSRRLLLSGNDLYIKARDKVLLTLLGYAARDRVSLTLSDLAFARSMY